MAKQQLQTFEQAAGLIKAHIIATPLIHSPTLSRMLGGRIYLKLENLQKTGSFKIRGALHKLLCESRQGTLSSQGVVAASAGNHAQGVAVAARTMNLPAVIVMPRWASLSKQEAVRNYGGRVVIHGATLEESLAKAQEFAKQGMTMIHPFDDPLIIAGQATIGLEIMAARPDVDAIVVPVGGGGLISGIAQAVKFQRPEVRIYGVQAAACPSVQASLDAGRRVTVKAEPSIADGISVARPGKHTLPVIRRWVDKIVAVPETDIAAAILLLLERKKILTEGAGAASLAALLNGSIQVDSGQTIVLVISGGNVDSPLLGRIVHQGLVNHGRIARIRLKMGDRPGTLAGVLHRIAELEANVLQILHNRDEEHTSIYEARVELTLETRSHEHILDILRSLEEMGREVLLVNGPSKP